MLDRIYGVASAVTLVASGDWGRSDIRALVRNAWKMASKWSGIDSGLSLIGQGC
jgi:hypothetical protein